MTTIEHIYPKAFYLSMIKKSTRYLTMLVLFLSICFCADGGSLKPVKRNTTAKKKPAPSQITAFKIPAQIAPEVIDETNHLIGLVVHASTPLTALTPTITYVGSTVTPNSGVTQDFTSAVGYIVDQGLPTAVFYSVQVLQARAATPICSGLPTTIIGDTPTPAGILGWEILNPATGTWSPAAGINTNPNYATATLSSNANAPKLYTFRRSITISGFVTWDSYTDLTVNPNTPIAGNTITPPATVTFCANGDAGTITGAPATGGDGVTYSYQWQQSTNGGGSFTDIAGAIGQNYDPPASTITTIYQRVVTSGACIAKSTSNPVEITIQNALANNTLTPPAVVVFCASGDPGNITGDPVTGGDGITYNYQWQNSTDGTNYNNIAGATNQNYDPPALTVTTYYQRVVTSGTCTSPLISPPVKITIQNALSNNIITPPSIVSFCAGGTPGDIMGNPVNGGDGVNYTYQWQISTDGVNYSSLIDGIGQNYHPQPITQTTWYQRTVTSGACTTASISIPVKISVTPAITSNIINQPPNAVYCAASSPVTITVQPPTGGDGTYTYQWTSSTDNVTYNPISGATAADYAVPALTATTWFKRVVSSGACIGTSQSNPVVITVYQALANNTLTAPSVSSFCQSGNADPITGTLPTGGDGNYTYQWQQSPTNAAGSFTDINGQSGASFDPPNLTSTMFYRRVVMNSICATPLISNVIEIHITPPITFSSILSPPFSYCVSVDPETLSGSPPQGGDGGNSYQYQWYSSTDNGANWNPINGATGIDYDPPTITQTTWFRRDATSGACQVPFPSNIAKIVVNQTPADVAVAPVAPICAGNKVTISVTSPDPALTYIWYDTPTKDNILFTGPTYITDILTASKTFYVEASNGTCPSPTLTSAPVAVNPLPAAPTLVTNPVSTCQGSTATLNISNPQAGITYNWYTTATGGASAFTGPNFTTPPINADITYYAEAASSSGCVSSTRTVVPVSVLPLPTVTAQGANVCAGETATLTTDNTDIDVTIKWYTSPTGGTSVFTGNSFTTPPINANTTYYAEAVNNTCVSATRSIAKVQLIQPLPAPVVSVESAVAPNITFSWPTVTEATGYQVSIDGGQTFTDPSSGSGGTTHTVTGLQIGQSVTLIVRATGGVSCQLSNNSAPVTGTAVNPLVDQIFVANAFTPNGDGKNDIVYVHNENIKSLKFYVYDQLGELLYVSQSQQNGWDGTFKGKTEPAGVYVYFLEAIMNDGKQVKKKGTITLLR